MPTTGRTSPRQRPRSGSTNFWGYSPVSFFAPHGAYAAGGDPRREFRDLVKALHAAGIGIILDVVLNHTAEGGADGPTINYKGLVNELFYLLDPEDRSKYLDFTGCGNTVSSNQALVAQWLVEVLRFWAVEMHVDGFRFDLAGVLSRDEEGKPLAHAPVIAAIELAPELRGVHLIAEAWDAGGLYQVGSFPGFRWAEWNGRYRDTVRRFLRGEPGHLGELATRIAGSSDLYAWAGKRPQNGINFVTCHDGFTLHDLVSYGKKHNSANGEHNRDGRDDNMSWNSGLEGATDDAQILRLRTQRARNFMALLLLSQGVPMLTAGDEVLRTQRGNNNAYCQDNDISWLDWSFAPAARAMLRFTRELIALRKRHPSLRRTRFLNGHSLKQAAEIHWYGASLDAPDWQAADAQVLCFTLAGVTAHEPALHVMINMAPTVRNLPLPDAAIRTWRRIVDTTFVAPDDIVPAGVAIARQRLPARPARYRRLRGQWVRATVMRMKTPALALLVLVALGVAPAVDAQDGTAYYGISLGEFDYTEEDGAGGDLFSDSVSAWHLMVGYQFMEHLAVEGSYGQSDTIRDTRTFPGSSSGDAGRSHFRQ